MFKRQLKYIATCLRYSTKHEVMKQKTYPIDPSANVLRHLQFTKTLPFEKGLRIQEQFVRAQLDIKQLESKISKRLKNLKGQNETLSINQHEEMILNKILEMKPNPMVLTFEFEPTYTGGKRIKKIITQEQINMYENFIPKGQSNLKPKFVQVERGGQITFHGPGQMVAYIILDLKSFHNFPAKCLVSSIETATIETLNKTSSDNIGTPLNLKAFTRDDTGVWVGCNEKIASIGIHIRRSITSHGVAINVNPDLSYLNNFTMCGLENSKTTSISNQFKDSKCDVNSISINFVKELSKILGITTVERFQIDELNID